MYAVMRRIRPVQNLGLTDRAVRTVIAAAMIGLPAFDVVMGSLFGWHGYVMLLGIYPALTAMLGWDPFYSMLQVRSCGTTLRNQCGSLPYEVDAALGHNPIPDKGYEFDHSLLSAHHLQQPRTSSGSNTPTPKAA